MTTTRSAIDRMAAQAMPAREEMERIAPAGAREQGLTRILAQPRLRIVPAGSARRSWLPLQVAAAVLATVLVVVVVTVPALRGAATPAGGTATTSAPPADPFSAGGDAATLFEQLAERAAAQPPRTGQGPYDYGHFQRWDADIEPDAGGKPGTGGNTTDVEYWLSADRPGRIVTTETGQPPQTRGAEPDPRPQLPADPAALERVLSTHLVNPPSAEGWFTAAAGVELGEVVDPPVRAALLRLLAKQGDVTVAGPVTDPAGRAGVAVSTRPGPASGGDGSYEHTLIFDPETGAMLAEEHVQVEPSDTFPTAPMTIAYTVGLGAGRVDAIGERP
jgi:hypothetical protein